MKRLLVVLGVVSAGLAAGGAVQAAEPVSQACLGESFSSLASSGPGFGQGVKFFVNNPGPFNTHPGIGEGIEAIQAGLVPDFAVLNTCND
jgi:hypothetical protein